MRAQNLGLLLLPLLFSACGKNDGFRNVGYGPQPGPIYQAPSPGGFPPPYPPGPGGFAPNLPPGYPPQYTPFLPIDQYMRDRQMMDQWMQTWMQWQKYARPQQINIYNFNSFWYDFCPTSCGNYFEPYYDQFDTNFYSWMTPQTQIYHDVNPMDFWQNYQGYSFDFEFDYCGGGCW